MAARRKQRKSSASGDDSSPSARRARAAVAAVTHSQAQGRKKDKKTRRGRSPDVKRKKKRKRKRRDLSRSTSSSSPPRPPTRKRKTSKSRRELAAQSKSTGQKPDPAMGYRGSILKAAAAGVGSAYAPAEVLNMARARHADESSSAMSEDLTSSSVGPASGEPNGIAEVADAPSTERLDSRFVALQASMRAELERSWGGVVMHLEDQVAAAQRANQKLQDQLAQALSEVQQSRADKRAAAARFDAKYQRYQQYCNKRLQRRDQRIRELEFAQQARAAEIDTLKAVRASLLTTSNRLRRQVVEQRIQLETYASVECEAGEASCVLPHRSEAPLRSKLARRKHEDASGSAQNRRRIVFAEGEALCIETGVLSFRGEGDKLWVHRPAWNVECDSCALRVPQADGVFFSDTQGGSQFTLDRFLCRACHGEEGSVPTRSV